MPDALSNILIQGDGVAETTAAWMRGSSQKAIVRRMPAIDVRMGYTAENGEVGAMLFEHFQVRR